MKLKFAFARRVAVGFLAVAVAAAGANAFAANYTWKGGNTTPTKAWATGSNWAQSGTAAAVAPQNLSTVVIGPLGGGTSLVPVQRTINVATDTNTVQSLTFTANSYAGYTFSGAGAIVLAPSAAIVNNNSTLTGGSTQQASVVLKNVTLNGNASLSGNGAPTEIYSVIDSADPLNPGTLTVSSNNLILQGTTVNVNLVAGTGSTVSLDAAPSFLDLTIGSAGSLGGLPGRGPGVFFGATGTGNLDLQLASNSYFAVAGTSPTAGDGGNNYDQYATDGAVNFGGTLNLDWAQVGSSTFTSWTTFSLFDGGSYTGNFSQVNLAGNVAPYAGLTFNPFGSEWKTDPFIGAGGQSQWLVFQSQSGNLVVVPEPSTIVFAGLGVAMSGWTMWKKRRLSKLLAAKAG